MNLSDSESEANHIRFSKDKFSESLFDETSFDSLEQLDLLLSN